MLFEIQLKNHDLGFGTYETIISLLKAKYLNKIYERQIITYIGEIEAISPMDADTGIVIVKAEATTLNYTIDSTIEGEVDINQNPPIFKSGYLKCNIDEGFTRGIDCILDENKNKITSKCKVQIKELKYINYHTYIHGNVKLIST
jgi:hypothetical protein